MSKTNEKNALKSMIISCYTYGGIERDSWNFERYLKPYISILGQEQFNKIYEQEKERLSKYKVIHNVYQDSEGYTYNELILND